MSTIRPSDLFRFVNLRPPDADDAVDAERLLTTVAARATSEPAFGTRSLPVPASEGLAHAEEEGAVRPPRTASVRVPSRSDTNGHELAVFLELVKKPPMNGPEVLQRISRARGPGKEEGDDRAEPVLKAKRFAAALARDPRWNEFVGSAAAKTRGAGSDVDPDLVSVLRLATAMEVIAHTDVSNDGLPSRLTNILRSPVILRRAHPQQQRGEMPGKTYGREQLGEIHNIEPSALQRDKVTTVENRAAPSEVMPGSAAPAANVFAALQQPAYLADLKVAPPDARRAIALVGELTERLLETAAEATSAAESASAHASARRPDGRPSLITRALQSVFGGGTRAPNVKASHASATNQIQRLNNDLSTRYSALSQDEKQLLAYVGINTLQSVGTITTAIERLDRVACNVADNANLAVDEPARDRFFHGRQATADALSLGLAAAPHHAVRSAQARSAAPAGAVQSIGFADLMVVRERLLRYEPGEIAHVENVLSGETRERFHTRTRSSEDVLETEEAREQEESKDLQTTQRFELQAEVQNTLQATTKIDVGVNATASYGTVGGSASLSASLAYSQTTTKETSQRNASTFAKEIVSKAASKTRETARTLRRSTTRDSVEERNSHKFAAGQADVTGFYRWIDKVYEVELRNYGTRLMFEFYIPEPGAFLMQQELFATDSNLAEPPPFMQLAAEIGPENYLRLAHRYQVLDIEPPQPRYRTIDYAFKGTAGANRVGGGYAETDAKELEIPDGYIPVAAVVNVSGAYEGSGMCLSLAAGDTLFVDKSVEGPYTGVFKFSGYMFATGAKGIALTARLYGQHQNLCTVLVHVVCERSCRAYQAWQIKTHDAIMKQYVRLKSDYDERIAGRAAAAGVQIRGRNSLENRRREQEELKKSAIHLLRREPYAFDAVTAAPLFSVEPAQADEDREIVQFYESAFEWSQMTYFCLPYFWGRTDAWSLRQQLDDPDPVHSAFLRAGGARLFVPVTPGYEHAVLAYLDAGGRFERERIHAGDSIESEDEVALSSEYAEIWVDLLRQRRNDLALGSGRLSLTHDSANVTVNAGSAWALSEIDVGRELYIAGGQYFIATVTSETGLMLDRKYLGATNGEARFVMGSARVGVPWEEHIPTSLVVLDSNTSKIPRVG